MSAKAHVTLIRGPVFYSAFRPDANPNALPPLGVAYLAGTLRAAGHPVTCIDAPGEALDCFRASEIDASLVENGLTMKEIIDRIPTGTEIIGVSCMFSFEWFYTVHLIRAIRARFPTQFIVLGGEHSTHECDYILKTMPEVDACVLGEGENKFVLMLQALADGVPKHELPGAAMRDPETGLVRRNDEKDGQYRILDVDSIPRPAWDLLPIEEYLDKGGYGSVGSRAMPLLASRGCPHRCTFCSSPQMWTTRWKARDVDDVIDEIKDYQRRYGIDRIEFYDLTAIIDKKWILDFCQKVIDQKLGITWAMPSGTRTEALTPDVLHLIKKSGCHRLSYPIETGSRKTCDLIKKKINYERSLGSMREAVKAGIAVKTHLIIGFPWQSYGDVFREYLFAIRLAWIGSHDTMFYNFQPYPGSELHAQLVTEGRIKKDESYPRTMRLAIRATFKDCQSWAPRISGPALGLMCVFGILMANAFQFVFRPQRAVSAAYRLFTGKPLLTMPELLIASVWSRFVRRFKVRSLKESRA